MNLYDSIVYEAIAGSGGGGGGGSSSYELITSTEFAVSTTSTSNVNVGRINISPTDEPFDTRTILYTRIYDKAGNRKGYFCENHTFWFTNDGTSYSKLPINFLRKSDGTFSSPSSAIYGVFADAFVTGSEYNQIQIKARYDSSRSLTIDGTYVVEAYKLKYSNDASITDRAVE